MSFPISQFRNVQDKTKLVGAYFFLAGSILYVYFSYINFFSGDLVESFSQYLIFITITSILSAFFYYVKLFERGFKILLIIIGRSDYRKYYDVEFKEISDHIYILDEKNRFLSKIIFISSLVIISLLFLNNFYILLVIIIGIIILAITAISDYRKELIPRIKLSYFMELIYFSQKKKLDPESVEKRFIFNIEKKLWFEAKQDFRYIINNTFKKPIERGDHEPLIKMLKDFLPILIEMNISTPSEENLKKFLTEVNQIFPLQGINIQNFKNRFSIISKSFELVLNFFDEISKWDEWMLYFIFAKNYDDLWAFQYSVSESQKWADTLTNFFSKISNEIAHSPEMIKTNFNILIERIQNHSGMLECFGDLIGKSDYDYGYEVFPLDETLKMSNKIERKVKSLFRQLKIEE